MKLKAKSWFTKYTACQMSFWTRQEKCCSSFLDPRLSHLFLPLMLSLPHPPLTGSQGVGVKSLWYAGLMALALKGLWFADSDPSLPSWLVEPIYHRRNSQTSQSVSQHLSQQESRVKVLVYFIFVIFPSLSFLWFYHILVFFNVIILFFYAFAEGMSKTRNTLRTHTSHSIYVYLCKYNLLSFLLRIHFYFYPPKILLCHLSAVQNWKLKMKDRNQNERWWEQMRTFLGSTGSPWSQTSIFKPVTMPLLFGGERFWNLLL